MKNNRKNIVSYLYGQLSSRLYPILTALLFISSLSIIAAETKKDSTMTNLIEQKASLLENAGRLDEAIELYQSLA